MGSAVGATVGGCEGPSEGEGALVAGDVSQAVGEIDGANDASSPVAGPDGTGPAQPTARAATSASRQEGRVRDIGTMIGLRTCAESQL